MQNLDYPDKIKDLKDKIRQMLEERAASSGAADAGNASSIWIEVLSVFRYIMDLSPENMLNIRFHTDLVTGSNILQFWHPYPPINPEKYARKSGYKFYTETIPADYWGSEPPAPNIPRPIGVNYEGRIINGDIARYQSCITNLYLIGIMDFLLERDKRKKIVIEIGGGYGGLAHQLGNMLSEKSTYIIMDFPEMLLMSAAFLIVNNGDKKIYIYNKETFNENFLKNEIYNYDYVLLPNYVLEKLYDLNEIHLMINMLSFQEMTKEQINDYLDLGAKKICGYLYSDNLDAHPYNENLKSATVSDLLQKKYSIFPSRETYNKIKSFSTWSRKIYCGIPNDKDISFKETSRIDFISDCDKYSFFFKNGLESYSFDRNWAHYLALMGEKVYRNIFQ